MRRREERVHDEAFAPQGLPREDSGESIGRRSGEIDRRAERRPRARDEYTEKTERRERHLDNEMPPPLRHSKSQERDARPIVPEKDQSQERPPQESFTQEQPMPSPPAPQADAENISPALRTMRLADHYKPTIPSEVTLLRDIPFTLQGVTTTSLEFASSSTLKIPPTLPISYVGILHTLAEPGLLYRGLQDFIASSEGGLHGQALRAAISEKLRSYLGLVAQIEGQVRTALSMLDESLPRSGLGKTGVTLKRCVIWTKESTAILRLLSLIAEESKSKKGGQLISLIHNFSTSHGDPLVGRVAEQMLKHVTRPFYDILRQWIYDGELQDPYNEFFVSLQDAASIAAAADGRKGAHSVWEDKYKIDPTQIPTIVSADFAQKVFLIGKSLNFVRHSCGDSLWVDDYSSKASKELRYGDTATLEAWIDEAYKTTMARLIHLMSNKYNLFTHLRALKDYLLLGAGDFIALLMESLSSNLDRPAGVQYRHTLTAQLDHAIRGSNAQYDTEEVRRRLDARMLHFSHGELGWDCFTLEYKIDAPIDVVVTEWGGKQYLKVFNFLWRIKRVEFCLSTTWRKIMTGARAVLSETSLGEEAQEVWKATRGSVAEMIHFVGQLQYYILFEVIQSSWDELQGSIDPEEHPHLTLDDIIRAHTKYLLNITNKGLLGATKKVEGREENAFMKQLNDLLYIMLSYRDAVDGLYSWSVAEFTRGQEGLLRSETRMSGVGYDSDDDLLPTPKTTRRGAKHLDHDSVASTPALGNIPGLGNVGVGNEEDVLQSLDGRLKAVGAQFKSHLSVLLGDLAYQPDQDMRFLGVTMNFNDFYHARRRPSAKGLAPVKKSATAASMAGGGGSASVAG